VKNLGDNVKVDVELESKIRGFDNKTYASKVETFAITNNSTRLVFLNVPPDLPLGNYVFYSRVSYNNITASSYDVFTVTERINWGIILISIIYLVLIFAILMIIKQIIKSTKQKQVKGAFLKNIKDLGKKS